MNNYLNKTNKSTIMIKDINNIETIINSGYGLDGMNEKRINMNAITKKTNRKVEFFNYLAAMFV